MGFTRSSLRWTGILSKRNMQMTQYMWKDRNSFVHPHCPNVLGFNEYNIIKNNILTELNLGKKDTRKGNIHPMKDTEESIKSLSVDEQQAWVCSFSLPIKDKISKYKRKFTHTWKNVGVYGLTLLYQMEVSYRHSGFNI